MEKDLLHLAKEPESETTADEKYFLIIYDNLVLIFLFNIVVDIFVFEIRLRLKSLLASIIVPLLAFDHQKSDFHRKRFESLALLLQRVSRSFVRSWT